MGEWGKGYWGPLWGIQPLSMPLILPMPEGEIQKGEEAEEQTRDKFYATKRVGQRKPITCPREVPHITLPPHLLSQSQPQPFNYICGSHITPRRDVCSPSTKAFSPHLIKVPSQNYITQYHERHMETTKGYLHQW